MNQIVTIRRKLRRLFCLEGVGLAEAQDAFATCDVEVRESFGVVEVVDTSLSTVRAKLRDAGFRTKVES